MPRPDDTAYAANWRTVLAVDGLVGAAALVAGSALVIGGTVVVGAAVGAFGALYTVLVVRRFLRWRRLRAQAGL